MAILGLLLLLLLVPVSVRLSYRGEFHAVLRVLGIPITLYSPEKKKAKKKRKKGRPARHKKKEPHEEKGLAAVGQMLKEDGVGGVVSYLSALASLLKTTARRFLASVTIDRLELTLVLAGEDAAQTAVLHGAVCGAVFPALATLENYTKIRRREVRIAPDFVQGENKVTMDVHLHAMPIRVQWTALRFIVGHIGNTLQGNSAKSGSAAAG